MFEKYTNNSLQEFYTEAPEIRDLMLAELGDVSNSTVLEPAVGKGAFLRGLPTSAKIEALDINLESVEFIQKTFGPNVSTQHGDFIDYFVSGSLQSGLNFNRKFDAVICNPPYGLKFSIEYRAKIKKKFPNVYARESYGLFIKFSLMLLKPGARFVFIVPDTFLSSRNHRNLRSFLMKETAVEKIYIFGSERFESVNYGYGGMCIITGFYRPNSKDWTCQFIVSKAKGSDLTAGTQFSVNSKKMLNIVDDGWASLAQTVDEQGFKLIELGEIAECKTGLYTGNNIQYCAFTGSPARKVNGSEISPELIRFDALTASEKLLGIEGKKCFVPFVRGGHWLPLQKQSNYVNWSVDAVQYYQLEKKARLQNKTYYFRDGIAVPMVTSGKITASLMHNSVFDQGVVGVFPKNRNDLETLLVFLNSQWATHQKHAINPSANNSANYLKRLKFPKITDELRAHSAEIVRRWGNEGAIDKAAVLSDCQSLFNKISPNEI